MKTNFLKTCLMLCLLLIGVGSAWGEETATLTFTAACSGSGTDDQGNSWTVTSDAAESTYDDSRGVHYGTGKKAVSYLTLTNSSITGTITKIVVNASGASSTSAKIDVKVGGSAFDSQQSLTSSNAAYTFDGSASGNIVIALTQTSATKALYVKSVAVTYTTAPDTRTAVNMTDFSATETTLIKDGITTTTVTNDQNTWTAAYTYQSSNTNVATVSNTGVITAVAKGTATITASLNIANNDATWKKGATASKSINITVNNPSHVARFSVNGAIDSNNNRTIEEGDAVTFPSDPADVNGKKFQGWKKGAAINGTTNSVPTFVNTASENMNNADVIYYAVFATVGSAPETLSYGWESTMSTSIWTSNNLSAGASYESYKHNGSYAASNGSATTAYIQTKNKIAKPTSATCYYTKASGNTNTSSKFIIQVSTNGSSWTDVSIGKTMDQVTQGTFEELTADISSYSNVFVRFYYSGTSASRVLDDVSVTYTTTTISDYCTNFPKEMGLTAGKLATYSSATPFEVSGDGVKVYKAEVDGDNINLSVVENKQVPAGVGVLLYSESAATATITPIASASALENNDLVATTTATTPCVAKPITGYVYVLGTEDNLFHPYLGANFAPNKAYILLNEEYTQAPALRVIFVTETATAIDAATNSATDVVKFIENGQVYILRAGVVYDIMGRVIR